MTKLKLENNLKMFIKGAKHNNEQIHELLMEFAIYID